MKTRILFKVFLILLIPVIYFITTAGFREKVTIISKAVSIVDNPVTKEFTNLIFTDKYFGRYDSNDPRAIEKNINNIKDSLHFNSIHVYGYDSSGGKFDEPISNYSSYVSGLMERVSDSGLNGYYGRWKIERLCYGQRLVYEAEGGNSGFSYTNNSGYVTTDSGRQVVKACLNTAQCPETDATPRYLCQNIYENLQHGDLIDFTQLDTAEWFIKPVMRIDSNIAHNNFNDSVVRIDVINYSGKLINSFVIKAGDFLNNGNYSGKYISKYQFPLTVTGECYDTTGLNYGMRNDTGFGGVEWRKWKDSCKVDFKVWWYGKVEVWFDKMIVDDYWGNELFSGIDDYKIVEEVSAFTTPMGKGSFFIDELTHSNIPCVQRVDSIMRSVRTDTKLNFAVTNYFNIRSYKDNTIGNRELLKMRSESFSADAHEIVNYLNFYNGRILLPYL
jgi:hypothetical protein